MILEHLGIRLTIEGGLFPKMENDCYSINDQKNVQNEYLMHFVLCAAFYRCIMCFFLHAFWIGFTSSFAFECISTCASIYIFSIYIFLNHYQGEYS